MRTDFINVVPAPHKRWSWTPNQKLRMQDVKKVVIALQPYWPLTVRQVYYQVISLPGFVDAAHWLAQKGKNKGLPKKDYYEDIVALLKWGRITGDYFHLDGNNLGIPMYAINDSGRKVSGKVGFSSTRHFFEQQIDGIFNGYSACLAQNQERYIEVWTEKLALFHIIKPTVDNFCRRTLAVRGYSSVTALADYARRAMDTNNPTILYFGDLDVNGIEIPETILESLKYEHGLKDVEIIRCGLNPNQTVNLNASPVPLKGKEKQKKHFIEHYGDKAYELDAVQPDELQRLVHNSLAKFTDMEVLKMEKKAGEKDREKFDDLQEYVEEYARELAVDSGLIVR